MDILQALEHHRAGRLPEAVAIYERLLQANPDDCDALHLMGKAAAELGDASLAVALTARAHALAPAHGGYLLSLGQAHQAGGQTDAALACLEQLLAQEPHSAAAWFQLGLLRQSLGEAQAAGHCYAQAVAHNPGMVAAHFNLGNLAKDHGQPQQALAHYAAALALQPDLADAHHNSASALEALGQPQAALQSYARALHRQWPETYLRMGNILTRLGRTQEAQAALQDAMAHAPDPAQVPGLAEACFDLGVQLARQDQPEAACASFAQAVALRPDHLQARYNQGLVLGQQQRLEEAASCYRAVLAQDPAYLDAHINLSAILMSQGQVGEAQAHLDYAYSRQNLFEKKTAGADKTVLILFDAGQGNVNLSHLFKERHNNLIDWFIDYATPAQFAQLPPHDLVFNAMGAPEITQQIPLQVRAFLQFNQRPLLNHPDHVARTARERLPALLAGIDHLSVPPVWRLPDGSAWPEEMAGHLPLLLRPVETHGGIGQVLVHSADELALCRARQQGALYGAPFVDYRSADGYYRKYRIIYIDRRPLPYHLAISPHWMVHYVKADMDAHTWKLDEEMRFLADPPAVLGAAGMRAIEAIGRALDLDYAGIDFSLLPDGRILVFEANPVMLVHPEKAGSATAHKNVFIARILDAFEDLLQTKRPRSGQD